MRNNNSKIKAILNGACNNKIVHFKIAFVSLIITIIFFMVSCGTGLAAKSDNGKGFYLRSIDALNLNSLETDSKWRLEPLNTTLSEVLEDDLIETTSCDQAWHFTADEYDSVRDWCLQQEKSLSTNKKFISEFSSNQIR